MEGDRQEADYGGRLWPEGPGLPSSDTSIVVSPRSARSKALPAIVVALLIVGAIAAGGSGLVGSDRASRATASIAAVGSPVGPNAAPVDSPAEQVEKVSRVDVYAALISHLNQRRWRTVYVSRRLCNQFPMGHGKCAGRLTHRERRAILSALPSIDLTFREPPKKIFSDYLDNYGLYAHVVLGPIVVQGKSVSVEAGYSCIYTCGYGTTYVLRERAGGWRVTDQVGESWIS
ncbi:MAG: hypothetical protein ABI595_15340 [Actinomycetota bacterium]